MAFPSAARRSQEGSKGQEEHWASNSSFRADPQALSEGQRTSKRKRKLSSRAERHYRRKRSQHGKHQHDRADELALRSELSRGRTMDGVLSAMTDPWVNCSALTSQSNPSEFSVDRTGSRTVAQLHPPAFVRFARTLTFDTALPLCPSSPRFHRSGLHTEHSLPLSSERTARLRFRTRSARQINRRLHLAFDQPTIPIQDAQAESYQSADERGGDENTDSDDMKSRTEKLNELTRTQPHSENAWLQLASHQDRIAKTLTKRSEVVQLTEKKRSILERGLEHVPSSIELAEALMAERERVLAPESLIESWRDMLRHISNSSRLWRKYIATRKSLHSVYTVTSQVGECEKAIQALLDKRNVQLSEDAPWPEIEQLEQCVIEFLEELIRTMLQGGKHEAGIARIQAVLEYGCFSGQSNQSESAKLRSFESFWQSSLQKVGSATANTWERCSEGKVQESSWSSAGELRHLRTHEMPIFAAREALNQQSMVDEYGNEDLIEYFASEADNAMQGDLDSYSLRRWCEIEYEREARCRNPVSASNKAGRKADLDPECVVSFANVRGCLFTPSSEPLQVELVLSLCRLLGFGSSSFIWQSIATESRMKSVSATESSAHPELSTLVRVNGSTPPWLDISGRQEGAWLSGVQEQAAFVRRLMHEAVIRFPYCSPLCDFYFGLFQTLSEVRAEGKRLLKEFRDSVPVLNAWCKSELRCRAASKQTEKLCNAVASESPFKAGVPGIHLSHAQLQLAHGDPINSLRTLEKLGQNAATTIGEASAADGFRALVRKACSIDEAEGISPLADCLVGSGLESCVAALLYERLKIDSDEDAWRCDFGAIEQLAKELLLIPRESLGMHASAESLHLALSDICCGDEHVATNGVNFPIAPGRLMESLRHGLLDFPAEPKLMSRLIRTEDGTATGRRILAQARSRASVTPVPALLASLRLEWRAGASIERLRSVLERALHESTSAAAASPVVWRTYMALEAEIGTLEAGTRAFSRAIQACPGCKQVWLDGFSHGFVQGEEARDLLESMQAKEIRCYSDVEEAMLERALRKD